MNAIIFDGKLLAEQKEELLKKKVSELKKKRITPKLISLLIGRNTGSELYLSLKRKVAERIGVEVTIKKFPTSVSSKEVIDFIKRRNKDGSAHGVMVQLPLPKNFSNEQREEIIEAIAPEKDVDGMREDSSFLTPAVKAVILAIKEAEKIGRVVVVGEKGFVGKKLTKVLQEMSYKVEGVDIDTGDMEEKIKKADILISATGKPGLIKKDMVKDGVVVIDVGAPRADVEKGVYKKASFITPVPGGIGPVTIACLLENLVSAC